MLLTAGEIVAEHLRRGSLLAAVLPVANAIVWLVAVEGDGAWLAAGLARLVLRL